MNQLELFGRRIRAIRKAGRVTQEQAAEKARLNAKYVGQIERGEKRPSFEAIIALARALQVSPAAFFQFDAEEMNDKALRRNIEAMLRRCNSEQLRQLYRIIKAVVEP